MRPGNPLTLALAAALLLPFVTRGHAFAQAIHSQIVILQIDSVIAADTNQGVDPELGEMGPRLKRMFHYSTYHLVSQQNERAEMGKVMELSMPGGRILHIHPEAFEGDMVVMEVLLFQGEKPMFTTDLKMPRHGNLIVGGPHYEQGELIITISTNMPPEEAPPALPTSEPVK
jgi:hypothetical protein